MAKQYFVLVLTAILILTKPTLAEPTSIYFDVISFIISILRQIINFILSNEEKLVCRSNEVLSDCIEGECQALTCSDLNRNIQCQSINPQCCTKACICEEGYLRADNGTCVPKYTCTFNCTGRNEEFRSCPTICPPNTCDSINQIYSCPAMPTNNSYCNPACECKAGFYRNRYNDCVSEASCLNCTGPNEYYNRSNACDTVCATLGEQNKTCSMGNNIIIPEQCYCEKGYARSENNTCIPINKCTEPQCPLNEMYVQCPSLSCTPQTCSQLGFPLNCTPLTDDQCQEEPGCVCIEGYVRNNNSVCIPQNDCPSCGGDENAVSGCGTYCGSLCSNYFNKGPTVCPDVCLLNGCQCKAGKYYDNILNKCVDPSQCINCTGSNEEFVSCPQTCPPQTCDSLNHTYNCPLIPISTNTSNCYPACRCKAGYYRNYLNECISEANCLKCTGPNEYYSCGGACDNVCATLNKQNQTNCPIVNIVCNKMCYCEKGYARAKNNTCVPINRCTEPQCPVNEEYINCPSLSCTPRTCSQLGFPLNCTALTSDAKCQEKPECVCIDGYVRNNQNVCIPQNECPTCGGDPNAEPGCSLNCNKQCSTLGQKVICPRIACPLNGCECKDGYYFNTTKCVLPEDCAPVCKKNEVYTNCTESDCRALNCSQLGYPLECLNSQSKKCTTGCTCVDGYLRADNGTCIPASSCPSCGEDINAVPGCGIYCNNRCSNIGQETQFCITLCKSNACDCKQNYYYDDNTGKCVLPADCTSSSITTSPIPSTTITPTTPAPQNNNETALAAFRKANLAFSGQLLYQSVQNNPGVNFVASALSALIPFTELALFAYGETLQQLLALLYFTDTNQIRSAFPALLQRFQGQQSVNFVIANKLYANENYPLTNTFEQDAQTLFNSTAENVDFTNAAAAADIINDWIAEVTNNLIQNTISADMLSADTRVVLVNAIYFLGTWSSQFNPANTKNRDFYMTPNETKSLSTMYQQGTFNYAEDSTLDAQILQLYYKGNNFSFVIWLPKTMDGLASMVDKLRDPNTFSNSMNSVTPETVQMYIPRMDIKNDINLIKPLQQYNVTDAFNPQTAQFNGIVTTNETIYISNAMQTTYIKVNETGTEAAAVTVVTGVATAAIGAPQTVYTFDANHPFVFCIKKQQDPVFIGIFTGQ